MKFVSVMLLAAAAVIMTAPSSFAQTHDADFPDQMRAINRCYVKAITEKTENLDLRACVEEQGFKFCDDCQIFRYSGGPCKKDHENGIHRATCYRPH